MRGDWEVVEDVAVLLVDVAAVVEAAALANDSSYEIKA